MSMNGNVRINYPNGTAYALCSTDKLKGVLHDEIEGVVRGDGTHREKREKVCRYLRLIRDIESQDGNPF